MITEEQQEVLHARLVKGAGILGTLWKDGIRCGAAWSVICVCLAPNHFCTSKKKWLGLMRELNDGVYPYDLSGCEGFLVLECMDEDMLKASGLKILKTAPGARALMRLYRGEGPFQAVLDVAEVEGADRSETGPIVRVQEIGSPG